MKSTIYFRIEDPTGSFRNTLKQVKMHTNTSSNKQAVKKALRSYLDLVKTTDVNYQNL